MRALEVAQPVRTENTITISRVTYLVYSEAFLPGQEVNYACRPYDVPVEGDGCENRNVAALCGFSAEAIWNPDFEMGGLFGDTLKVELDLSAATEGRCRDMDAAVEATVECVLTNAAKSADRHPYARVLSLRVIGPEEYAKHGGVYVFEELGVLPRQKDFY